MELLMLPGKGPPRGWKCVAALVALVVAPATAPARAAAADATDAPRIVAVEPYRDGGLLACAVRTQGLPGDRIASSLESGLPSAIELGLEVLDDRDRVVARNSVSWRLAFDLWEEIFKVEGPVGAPHRFADAAQLARFLESFPRIPVAPLASLAPGVTHRVRVDLELHAIAPRETARLDDWVAGREVGSEGAATGADDGREVSVGLGEIVRFFYRGGRAGRDGSVGRTSSPFVPDDLAPRAAEGPAGEDAP